MSRWKVRVKPKNESKTFCIYVSANTALEAIDKARVFVSEAYNEVYYITKVVKQVERKVQNAV
nr:MAG TPA: hypothetical protein [Caudoviricetes sp.]